jgi:N-methylhydantoinase A
VEIVNLRLAVIAARRSPPAEIALQKRGGLAHALVEKRKVWFPETGFVATPVYDRDRLPAQCRLVGPAIIEQMDATTVVPPKARVKNDAFGYLHMKLEAVAQKGKARWAAV